MKKIIVFSILVTGLVFSCNQQQKKGTIMIYKIPKVVYPLTRKVNISDIYFGTEVTDPYRWLEDDSAAEVKKWVEAENKITFDFLDKIPFRAKFRKRLEEIFNYTRITSPAKIGNYYLYYKNDGLQNQSIIYIRKGTKGQEEVFIDPNKLSENGTTAVSIIGIPKNNKYVAYSISKSGSDWQEIHVKGIPTGKELPDVLNWVKFSGASWFGEGFFYSRYPKPEIGEELVALNKFQTIYYHKLGDPQSKDILIYKDEKNPLRYHSVYLSEDEKYIFLITAEGTDGFECYYKPVDLKQGGFVPLFTGFENKSTVIDHNNGLFYVLTNIDAPNFRLITLDPKKPEKSNWKEIIPESPDVLERVISSGGKLIAQYLKDVTSRLYVFDYSGNELNEISLPTSGTVSPAYRLKTDPEFLYSFTSFTYPTSIFRYDVNTYKQDSFFKPVLSFDPDDFEIKQVFYTSRDSSTIPMFIVYKKGIMMDGGNPTILYGYGGFSISETPAFLNTVIPLLENGGIYALANIRGGNEYGERWHKDGMLLKKQNVFNDFIAAAKFLIREKYTSPTKLGISGGSNGGLQVGACMIQRPELFKVALPDVGVMDMLRYQKFTVGFGWVPEYGSSDDSLNFINLYKYSPLQNIKSGVEYPATFITTGDHDDRVVPAHSFKFAATLQEKVKGNNPILIRIETQAGHGAGKPISKIIEENVDKWAFFFFNTQSPVKY